MEWNIIYENVLINIIIDVFKYDVIVNVDNKNEEKEVIYDYL